MNNPPISLNGSQGAQQTTLLALVQALTRQGHSEREIETQVLELVESGRVVLIGNFRALPLRSSRPAGRGAGRGGSRDDTPTHPRPPAPRHPVIALAHFGPWARRADLTPTRVEIATQRPSALDRGE